MVVEVEGSAAPARRVSTDIIEAAARAYVRALSVARRARGGPADARAAGPRARDARRRASYAASVITYTRMTTSVSRVRTPSLQPTIPLDPAVIGARVRALRESSSLSLRDLAARSGVSAPMLSQVERGETSPTLAVAARIAAGLELRLSQLLRLDEDGAVTIVRASAAPARGQRAAGTSLRGADRRTAGSARRALAPHARPGGRHGRARRPADARARQPRDRAGRARPVVLVCDGERYELARGRLRDFRRRSAPPLREPHRREAGFLAVVSAGPAPQLEPRGRRIRCRRRCSTSSGRPTRSRTGCSTSTCTSSTRSPARRPSTACGWPAARCAGPIGRWRPPTTTRPPTAPPSPRDRGRALARPGRDAGAQLRRVRHPRLLARLGAPGDRARDRPRARRHAAGDDDRLWRLPHRHPRRLRRARVRHRHQRGRARARHPVHGPAEARARCGSATRARSASASPPRI